jgi:dihydrodipicolinate synthase/N-acetylneuraminate lyase
MCIGRHVWKLSGYAPALPTPFDENDAVDAAAFEHVCELQISNGATALVVGAPATDFRLLSGDDATALAFITQGGDGCISNLRRLCFAKQTLRQ